MIDKLVLPEIRELLAQHEHATLAEVLEHWMPADVASLLGQLNDEEDVHLLRTLPSRLAALTFEYLDIPTQERLLAALTDQDASRILDDMAPDDRTALLEDLPDERAQQLLGLMSPEQRDIAKRLLHYHEDSIGRLMTPDYVAVHKDWTIRRVLDHVRAHGKKSETLGVLYVVDAEGRLVDDISIGKIL
jgi:magnesium transporter